MEQQNNYASAIRTDIENGTEHLSEKIGSLDSAVGISQESLKEGFSTISGEIQVSGDHLRNIVRHELQIQLQPLVEEAMERSEMRRTATPRQLCPDVDTATTPATYVRIIRGQRDLPGFIFTKTDLVLVQMGLAAVGSFGFMLVVMG